MELGFFLRYYTCNYLHTIETQIYTRTHTEIAPTQPWTMYLHSILQFIACHLTPCLIYPPFATDHQIKSFLLIHGAHTHAMQSINHHSLYFMIYWWIISTTKNSSSSQFIAIKLPSLSSFLSYNFFFSFVRATALDYVLSSFLYLSFKWCHFAFGWIA